MPTRDRPPSQGGPPGSPVVARGGAAGNQNSAGHLLRLVRTGRARTRSELQTYTGLSRSTLVARIDALRAAGYLAPPGWRSRPAAGPAELLEFDTGHGVVLVADLGANHARAAVLDVGGTLLHEEHEHIKIGEGPGRRARLGRRRLRADCCHGGRTDPGQVRGDRGRRARPGRVRRRVVTEPPIMPGWDGVPIADRLRATWGRPIFVDNDANLMALGEQVAYYPDCPTLLLVKVATGIGAGIDDRRPGLPRASTAAPATSGTSGCARSRTPAASAASTAACPRWPAGWPWRSA